MVRGHMQEKNVEGRGRQKEKAQRRETHMERLSL